jgi:hypothetical protein
LKHVFGVPQTETARLASISLWVDDFMETAKKKRDRWTDGRIVSDDNHIHDRPSVKHDDAGQCHTNVRGRMFDFEPLKPLRGNKESPLIHFIHPSVVVNDSAVP